MLLEAAGRFTAPDGIAFGKSGKLYVAEALTNTVKVLNPNGTVAAVYSGPALNPPGLPLPPLYSELCACA